MNTPPEALPIVAPPATDGEIRCQCGEKVDPTATVRFDGGRYPDLRVVGCPKCCGWIPYPLKGAKKPH